MYLLRWLFYWFDLLIMMLWLEILGGCIHLSLQDPTDGHIWRNKPSLGFHGASSPQVGCQGPTCRITETCLWRLTLYRGGPNLAPATQMFCLKEAKRHFLEAWRHRGARVCWWWIFYLTLGMLWWEETWGGYSAWEGGFMSPNDLNLLLDFHWFR
jgi:hypothetical protein